MAKARLKQTMPSTLNPKPKTLWLATGSRVSCLCLVQGREAELRARPIGIRLTAHPSCTIFRFPKEYILKTEDQNDMKSSIKQEKSNAPHRKAKHGLRCEQHLLPGTSGKIGENDYESLSRPTCLCYLRIVQTSSPIEWSFPVGMILLTYQRS